MKYLSDNRAHRALWKGVPISRDGKVQLRDGRTGEPFDLSLIHILRELGSERRDTVRSLSGAGGGYLRGAVLSTCLLYTSRCV